ncbi:uncharacterized protein LOC134355867 [Mobula hypostoma]|uniref:uncharacterized protein LOC134355867 n=1 Tax=Mobula hypostoma TaxID=723540 RepID=UPI002FC3980E
MSNLFWFLFVVLFSQPFNFVGVGLTAAFIITFIRKKWRSRKLTTSQILMELIHIATKEDNNWKDVIQHLWNGGKVSNTSQSHRDASPITVIGARGHSVSLPPGIPVGPDFIDIEWRRVSSGSRVAQSSNGNIEYFGPKEYQRRITLHPGNFNLEISDLRREDAGDYEVIITAASGTQTLRRVQLEVNDRTGAPPTTVTGTRRHSVSLRPRIPVRPDVYDVVWRRVEREERIVRHSVNTTRYFGEYQQRETFHPSNFSLEIHDLQMQDAGHYQVTVTADSGHEDTESISLEVHEPGLLRAGLRALADAFSAVRRFLGSLFSCRR